MVSEEVVKISGAEPSSAVALTPLGMDGIEELDFTMIKLKLQDMEEGPGWSPDQCTVVEEEYKRFLALKRAYQDMEIVPDRLVDVFWHQHILDTAKYAADCNVVFGAFLHHYPYFGMNGDEDYANLCTAFEKTRRLYELHFDDFSWSSASAKCRTKCKPVKCK